jgi:ABC-type branched-subunit amino acid transport system ATPase component/ABC-type branched-subunit amino acid transport system permease subunit
MNAVSRSILHALGFIALLAVIALASMKLDIPPGQPGSILNNYGHELLLDIGIAITLAVSLNLILGIAGQFSLGHAGFVAAGAYTAAIISGDCFEPFLRFLTMGPFHFSTAFAFQAIMVIGMLAGTLVAAILGLFVGLPTLRLRGDYLAIATLGFGEILAVFIQNTTFLGSSTGLSLSSMRYEWIANQADADAPLVQAVQNYTDNTPYFVGTFAVFAVAALTIYIVHNIKYATSGRALLAIREDTIASESVGVSSTRYKVAAFVIGAALAGLAGGLVAHHKSLINPESFRFMRSIEIVAMVILGGQGSITGSILAAIFLTMLPEALRSCTGWAYSHFHSLAMSFPHTSSGAIGPEGQKWEDFGQWIKNLDIEKWRMVLYSLFIILAMLFRPQGLFGRYEISDLFRWLFKRTRSVSAGPSPAAATGIFPAHAATQPSSHTPPLLTASRITMQFGGLKAVDDFSLTLLPGELVGLIGPNGAGKTTAFNILTGVYNPTLGDVMINGTSTTSHWSFFKAVFFPLVGTPLAFAGIFGAFAAVLDLVSHGLGNITNDLLQFILGVAVVLVGLRLARAIWSRKDRYVSLKPHAISRRGVARTFQNIRLFGNLSVLDNVQIAQHAHHKQGIPSAILRRPAFYREEAESRRNALAYLELFNLAHLSNERANSLSYGDQRRLEIARALATRPKILMLDEPAAGMNPTEKRELMEMIRSIRNQFSLTILLIEHDMKVIMGICERILVLDYGKTIAAGTPDQIRKNPAVIEAYLGASAKQS